MSGENVTECLSCGAKIRFRENDKGRRMVLDASPSPEGNIVPLRDGRVHVLTKAERERVPENVTRYVSHHVTCPANKSWKGRNRANPPNIEAAAVCDMVQAFVERIDRIFPALLTCDLPDHDGGFSVWDDRFLGEPS